MKKLLTIAATIFATVMFSLMIASIVIPKTYLTSVLKYDTSRNHYFIDVTYDWGEDINIYLAPNTTYEEALQVHLNFLKNK